METTQKINSQLSILNVGTDFISATFMSDNNTNVGSATFLRAENPRLFQRARAAAVQNDVNTLSTLSLSILDSFEAIDSRFHVSAGRVFFEGRELNNFATEKIHALWKAGLPIDNWVNFIKNTMANPHAITVEDTYRFLEGHEGCPITDDGAILAYKKVDNDYMSFFSSSFTNKKESWAPGQTVELPRDHCDPDRNVTCSHGLHFCSRSYAPHAFWGSGRVVMVKVFPQDIVAIPLEYGMAKARCCKAYSVRDITDEYAEFAFLSSYTAEGEARAFEEADSTGFMDEEIFEDIEEVLSSYGQTLEIAGGVMTTKVYDLVERLTKFADSMGKDLFVYDEEDILYVLERTEDEDIKRMYNVEFSSDVFVRVAK